ncbi:hypothetical protein [Methanosarcina sp. 2.H.A.1B.4]|uniref:hypothetical protein n=1 Tax=Methanosarcina sp. 2.H.A.1B.4 TaxID=1483600 RepID=UPI0012E08A46|nr:hypothetical protein [Methanosarcina sp. 2.H.A.1B.4]
MPLNQAKKVILDVLFDNAATRLLNLNLGAHVDDLIVLAERGVDLQKTMGVLRACDGRLAWLGEGLENSWGWLHIIREKRLQQIRDKFGPVPLEKVEQMIYETMKDGQVTKYVPGDRITYTKEFPDKNGVLAPFSVGVSDRSTGISPGRVMTAHADD